MTDKLQNELRLEYKKKSSKGVERDINQDRILLRSWADKSGLLAVMVDGMGGTDSKEYLKNKSTRRLCLYLSSFKHSLIFSILSWEE